VFYTPRYITKYIVENTVGALCKEKKNELNLIEEDYAPAKKRGDKKTLLKKLDDYRAWLLQLTICDPACGSGAFLNAALEFLIAEHHYIDELSAKLLGHSFVYADITNDILEHNLFGVDINEEAVEIARLSLWLRTAQKGRKLSNLSGNIKCGNSLIDDAAVAGEKAFNWKEEFKDVFDKGGFDVVIGNPPYVPAEYISEFDKRFLELNYTSAFGRINLYPIFYEKAIQLGHKNSRIGFITPYTILKNQYYVEARRNILERTFIETIIDFKGTIVFADAAVDSIIMILKNSDSKNNLIKVIDRVGNLASGEFRINKVDQTAFLSKTDLSFELNQRGINTEKFSYDTQPLEKVLDFNQGVITGDNKKFLSAAPGQNHKKVITGSDFNRYSLFWNNQYLIYDEKALHRPRKHQIFECDEKILIRQTGSYPISTYDNNQYYTLDTVHNGILRDTNYSIKYLITLLNSSLFRFLYTNSINEEGKVFAQVKIIYLNPLPIKIIPLEDQQPFISKADIMFSKNKELQGIKQGLLQLLKAKHDGIILNKKLSDWPSLSFGQVLKELEKQKIKFSLPEQNEWLQYFEAEKQKASGIQQLIHQTDKEIDAMVYQLYNLTEEEISIVEKS
jgi:type I restriction-modification system DNA methylase subunit